MRYLVLLLLVGCQSSQEELVYTQTPNGIHVENRRCVSENPFQTCQVEHEKSHDSYHQTYTADRGCQEYRSTWNFQHPWWQYSYAYNYWVQQPNQYQYAYQYEWQVRNRR